MELGTPVTSLQFMLRQLAELYDFMPFVALDGIFDENTLEAVMIYQREFYPPATGVVTKELWENMRNHLVAEEENLRKPRVLRAFPEGDDPLNFGDEQSEIALFQTMFALLGTKVEGIIPDPPTGKFTKNLVENLIWLQKLSGLPVTGQLDRQTWDRLARLYEIYITAV